MNVALYARYSTDLQNAASIEDQHRACRERAAREGWAIVHEFSDAAMSAASMLRPGLQAMLRAAQAGEVDLVLGESLDRFSRDQEDIAALFKRLAFANVSMVTLTEGIISELHVGLSGTMAARFLKQLAEKTRRGLRGRVEAGRSGGGKSFGYSTVPSPTKGDRGRLEIHPQEAAIVQRIFREFIAGRSPKAIAQQLNLEGIPGPRAAWSPSTIHGHRKLGTGILNNTLYVGVRTWGRQRFVKDPMTRRRVARLTNAAITRPVPELQIIDDATWQAVKLRQEATQLKVLTGLVRGRRPAYLFSGITKCGECGGGFNLWSRDLLRCFNSTQRATCKNTRAISRHEVERRVLTALQTKFLADPATFTAFCEAFTEETNKLRREHRAKLATAPRELATIDRRQKQILEYLLAGFGDVEAWKDEVQKNEQRRKELKVMLDVAEPALPALHPKMSEIFRSKTMALAAALDSDDNADLARESTAWLPRPDNHSG